MSMLFRTLGLALCLVAASTGLTQTLTKTGTTAAALLKIGLGARPIGMGGAFAASSDDLSSIYWNPAGLGASYGSKAVFNHVNWIADVALEHAAVAIRVGDVGVLGAFVTALTMDEMPVRTLEAPEGTGERFTAGGLVAGVTYARALTDNFSIGFNAKYVTENIWNSSASAFALDVGTLYRIPVLNELRLAASVSNFGTKMKMEGRDNLEIMQVGGSDGNLINTYVEYDQFDLPLLFRVGVAADLVKAETMRLTAELDAVHPNDNTEYINVGTEVAWTETVFLRAGWKSLFERDTEQRFTLGVGFHYRFADAVLLALDYAYQDFGRLNNVQYLSVGVEF